jgi:hypothetical protein
MSTPFELSGLLNLPGTPGLPPDHIPFGVSNQYGSKSDFEFELTGTGTKTVNFGTMPAAGVKGLLVVYEQSTSSPIILLTVNGGSSPIELSSGGFLALGSPTPATGVTSLSIAYTGAGRVRIWLLG